MMVVASDIKQSPSLCLLAEVTLLIEQIKYDSQLGDNQLYALPLYK